MQHEYKKLIPASKTNICTHLKTIRKLNFNILSVKNHWVWEYNSGRWMQYCETTLFPLTISFPNYSNYICVDWILCTSTLTELCCWGLLIHFLCQKQSEGLSGLSCFSNVHFWKPSSLSSISSHWTLMDPCPLSYTLEYQSMSSSHKWFQLQSLTEADF